MVVFHVCLYVYQKVTQMAAQLYWLVVDLPL